MVNKFFKKRSKRISTRVRCKVEKKVREHNRKLKKEGKLNSNKRRKDPGVPNSCPFKEEVLKSAEQRQIRLEEEREKEKERRKQDRQKEMDKRRNLASGNLDSLVKNAQKRGADFERKNVFVKDQMKEHNAGKNMETSLKAYYKEFSKVIEAADVILQVLDARDPLGSRCPQVEEAVLSAGSTKRLVLVLNKIDLVPRENVENWLKYLRQEFPTVAFKASTQAQSDHLSQSKVTVANASDDLRKSSTCLGADMLMKLLGNYCRKRDLRTAITVGVVGFPNTGKSSLINSLKRSKACSVGSTPGVTKVMQSVKLDKHVKLLDSPGIVMATSMSDASTILRNCVKIETLEDPSQPVSVILKRCSKQQLMLQYGLSDFKDTNEFLALMARKMGRLKKGGIPMTKVAARKVLQDWNSGRITYYTHTPKDRSAASQVSAGIISKMSEEFDIEALLGEETAALEGLKCMADSDVVFDSEGPTQGMVADADMEDEDEEEDDEEMEEEEEEEEMSHVTVSAGRTRSSSASAGDVKKKKKEVKMVTKTQAAGNLQLTSELKKNMKKQKKDRRRRDKVAGNLSDALTGALSGLGSDLNPVSEPYDFAADFK